MDRRELLKALPAIVSAPIFIKGVEVGKAVPIEADKKYIVFLNCMLVDIEKFAKDPHNPLPAGTPVYAVEPYGPGSMDEVVRIYKT